MYDYILTDEHNIDNRSTLNNLNHRGFEGLSKSQDHTANNHNSNLCREEVLNENRNKDSTRTHITTGGDQTDNFSEDDSLENVNICDVNISPKVYYGKQFQKSHGHLTRKSTNVLKASFWTKGNFFRDYSRISFWPPTLKFGFITFFRKTKNDHPIQRRPLF